MGKMWSRNSGRDVELARPAERSWLPTVVDGLTALRALVASLAMVVALPAQAAPLENVSEIGPALLECWHPPTAPEGSAVTLRFGFRRDGSLIGAPRITYVGVAGDQKLQRAFADSAVRAIKECSPLVLSPRFAATIGGKVYVMQFALRKGGPAIRQMYA
jgi:hypothetical protein